MRATRSPKDWPEETLVALGTDRWEVGGWVLVLRDLPSDPSTSSWNCAPGERTQCFSVVWEGGLWGLGRCVSEEVVR